MQLNDITTSLGKSKKRVGRGGKRGATSGKGTKGQRARAGRKLRPTMRDLVQKIPKKRGTGFSATSAPVISIDLDIVEKHFKAGEKVTPRVLHNKDIINLGSKVPRPRVKILGRGQLTKKLIFENVEASQKATASILERGGEIRNV